MSTTVFTGQKYFVIFSQNLEEPSLVDYENGSCGQKKPLVNVKNKPLVV